MIMKKKTKRKRNSSYLLVLSSIECRLEWRSIHLEVGWHRGSSLSSMESIERAMHRFDAQLGMLTFSGDLVFLLLFFQRIFDINYITICFFLLLLIR